MKNKYMVEVYLPAAGYSYEMRLPRQIKVAKATQMIIDFIRLRDEGEYVPGDDAKLYDMSSGMLYDWNAFVDKAGISEGTRMMLV